MILGDVVVETLLPGVALEPPWVVGVDGPVQVGVVAPPLGIQMGNALTDAIVVPIVGPQGPPGADGTNVEVYVQSTEPVPVNAAIWIEIDGDGDAQTVRYWVP